MHEERVLAYAYLRFAKRYGKIRHRDVERSNNFFFSELDAMDQVDKFYPTALVWLCINSWNFVNPFGISEDEMWEKL